VIGLPPLGIDPGSLAPPLAARSDLEAIIGILWVAFMVIGGIYNWVKKQMEEAREKEEARRRAAGLPSLTEAPPAADPLQEAAAADADDARRALLGELPPPNPMRRAPDEESFEEYAARQKAERVRAERDARIREREDRKRLAALEKARAEEEERRHAAHVEWKERNREADVSAPVARVAPVVASLVAPGTSPSSGVGSGSVLPPELRRSLTEAQRLLVGAEIFGRPRMLRPSGAGRRRGPAAQA